AGCVASSSFPTRRSSDLVVLGEFIPLAEEMGLIETIGEWVLSELCRQSREWRDQRLELKVSFNLSPRELWRPNLVQSDRLKLTSDRKSTRLNSSHEWISY